MYCHNCGKPIPDDAKFCRYCGAEQHPAAPAAPAKAPAAPAAAPAAPPHRPPQAGRPGPTPSHTGQPPQERVGAGILGALLGSLAGVCVMVLLDRLGYVSSLSGIIMLGGAVWGYAHFGKALGKKSLIICVPIVAVMVYLGSRLCWAITVRGLYPAAGKPDLWDLFIRLPIQLEFSGLTDSYYAYLAQQYAFAALGVVLLVVNIVRGDRAATKNRRDAR